MLERRRRLVPFVVVVTVALVAVAGTARGAPAAHQTAQTAKYTSCNLWALTPFAYPYAPSGWAAAHGQVSCNESFYYQLCLSASNDYINWTQLICNAGWVSASNQQFWAPANQTAFRCSPFRIVRSYLYVNVNGQGLSDTSPTMSCLGSP